MDILCVFFFFQAEDGIRDHCVTGVQTCALPISLECEVGRLLAVVDRQQAGLPAAEVRLVLEQEPEHHVDPRRSEEHTSELQSHSDLVCRLLLEKKNKVLITSCCTYVRETKEQSS